MKRILFIGNSFTYFNNMPFILQQLAAAAGTEVYTRMVAYGGARLSEYLEPEFRGHADAEAALAAADWDAVVLQEQSFTPYKDPAAFTASVQKWTEKIHGACTHVRIFLYQTWSYRENSAVLQETITDTGYTGFYEGLKAGYEAAASATGAAVVPVGTAFYRISRELPDVDLFAPDDYHPSPQGSLAAAMTFYRFMVRALIPEAAADIPVIAVHSQPQAVDVTKEEAGRIAALIEDL